MWTLVACVWTEQNPNVPKRLLPVQRHRLCLSSCASPLAYAPVPGIAAGLALHMYTTGSRVRLSDICIVRLRENVGEGSEGQRVRYSRGSKAESLTGLGHPGLEDCHWFVMNSHLLNSPTIEQQHLQKRKASSTNTLKSLRMIDS